MVQASDLLEFNNAYEEVRGVLHSGRLKFQNNGIIFKNNKTGKLENILSNDISDIVWMRMATGMGLKLKTNNDTYHRFGGFDENDHEKLAKFISENFNRTLEEINYSVKGYNWGKASFDGSLLSFQVPSSHNPSNQNPALEIPLNYVSHCTSGKNEIALEFQQNDDAPVSLVEMRFYVPSSDNDVDPVKTFHDNVMAKANVIQAVGDAISTFPEAHCLTPRGRYDIKLYPTFAQLHGKTFDYKIPYSTILRLFVLPHKDNRQIFSVISLDPPIKQGQTRYPYLILLFDKDEDITMQLSLTEEEIQSKFAGKISKEMSGKTFEVFGRLMKALSGNKITLPGNFTSHSGSSCISCSYKAAAGYLYPLERGFMYVHKPPMHIRFDEVGSVNFARSTGTTTRTFDFEIETKAGIVHTFSSIVKEEYTNLFDFIKGKNLIVRNIGGKLDSKKISDMGNVSDNEDDDDAADPYLNRVKAEGKEREDGDDDDDEEEDEDFNPAGGDDDDVAEEYDSNVSSSDSQGSAHSGRKRSEKRDKDVPSKWRKHRDSGDGNKSSSSVSSLSADDDDDVPKSKGSGTSNKADVRKNVEPSKNVAKMADKGKRNKATADKGKKKAPKDPNMPKRPLSAYFIWLQENRERIKKENNNASVVDITKIAGEEWKKIGDKNEWEQKAARAKERYNLAMSDYKSNLSVASSQPKKTPTKTNTSTKQPLSKEEIESSDMSSLED